MVAVRWTPGNAGWLAVIFAVVVFASCVGGNRLQLPNDAPHATVGPPHPITTNPADKDALLELYSATFGAVWLDNTGWVNQESDPCWAHWAGVLCTPCEPATGSTTTACVETLSLSGNGLMGDLSSIWVPAGNSTTRLSKLKFLFLSDNHGLTGAIPAAWFSTFPSLRVLDLSSCHLYALPPESSLSEIPNAGALSNFDASDNYLHGRVPLWMVAHIPTLTLSNNVLSLMPALKTNQSTHEFVHGKVYLSNNQFAGPLDLRIFTATQALDVSYNRLWLASTAPSPTFASTLQILTLDHNNVTTLPAWLLETHPSLTVLSASYNAIDGPVPSGVFARPMQQVLLKSCGLTGPVNWAELQGSMVTLIDFSENQLTGCLPANGTYKLTDIYLSTNNLDCEVPPSFYEAVPNLRLLSIRSQKNLRWSVMPGCTSDGQTANPSLDTVFLSGGRFLADEGTAACPTNLVEFEWNDTPDGPAILDEILSTDASELRILRLRNSSLSVSDRTPLSQGDAFATLNFVILDVSSNPELSFQLGTASVVGGVRNPFAYASLVNLTGTAVTLEDEHGTVPEWVALDVVSRKIESIAHFSCPTPFSSVSGGIFVADVGFTNYANCTCNVNYVGAVTAASMVRMTGTSYGGGGDDDGDDNSGSGSGSGSGGEGSDSPCLPIINLCPGETVQCVSSRSTGLGASFQSLAAFYPVFIEDTDDDTNDTSVDGKVCGFTPCAGPACLPVVCSATSNGTLACPRHNDYLCEDGYEARLCARCSAGFYRRRGWTCTACPRGNPGWMVAVGAALLGLIVISFLCRQRRGRHIRICGYPLAVLQFLVTALFGAGLAAIFYSLGLTTLLNVVVAFCVALLVTFVYLLNRTDTEARETYSTLVRIGFIYVQSLQALLGTFSWPPWLDLSPLLQWTNVQVFGMSCLWPPLGTTAGVFVFTEALPAALCLSAGVVVLVVRLFTGGVGGYYVKARRLGVAFSVASYYGLAFTLWQASIAMFNCEPTTVGASCQKGPLVDHPGSPEPPSDITYLSGSPWIACGGPEWRALFAGALACLVVWLLIPLVAVLTWLWRFGCRYRDLFSRDRQAALWNRVMEEGSGCGSDAAESVPHQIFTAVCGGYRDSAWLYEFWLQARRLVLSLVLALTTSDDVGLRSLVVVGTLSASATITVLYRPFKKWYANSLEVWGLVAVAASFGGGAGTNISDEATVSVIVLLLNLLCIGGYVAAFAGVVMSSWRSRRRKRVRETAASGDAGVSVDGTWLDSSYSSGSSGDREAGRAGVSSPAGEGTHLLAAPATAYRSDAAPLSSVVDSVPLSDLKASSPGDLRSIVMNEVADARADAQALSRRLAIVEAERDGLRQRLRAAGVD